MNLAPYRNESEPRREVLPGGAILLSSPMPSAHAVTLGVFLRTGSQTEAAEVGGISHFIEHMVFKGTARHTAFELARGFDSIGAVVDAFTTKDMVAFTIKVLPDYFQEGVTLLAEMLLRPTFAPDLVAMEQQVVVEEIQEALDTPEDRLHDAFAARLYAGHGRGRPILGHAATVLSFDQDLLRREHARLLAGPNVVLAVSGNIMPGHMDQVAAAFADLSRGTEGHDSEDAPAAAASAQVDSGEPSEDDFLLEISSPIIQTYFELGNLGVPYGHPDRMGVHLLNNILGGGMSSRVFQAVREREGLAYTVYNYVDMGKDVGLVSCAGSCSPEKIGRLVDVIRAEYGHLRDAGLNAAELESNSAQLKSQLIFSLEGMVNRMFRLARNEIYYGRFVPVAEIVDEIDAVTPDQIMACAARYFDPDAMLVAVHGPEQSGNSS